MQLEMNPILKEIVNSLSKYFFNFKNTIYIITYWMLTGPDCKGIEALIQRKGDIRHDGWTS